MNFHDAFSSNAAWAPNTGLISGFGGGASAPIAAATQAQGASAAMGAGGILGGSTSGGAGGTMGAGSSGFGFNMDTGKLLLGGLQTIGSIWNAWEAQKLAKKQFAYQKDVTETNLKNQIQAYNTTLEDRGRSRAHTEGQDPGTAQAYIDNNRLKR